MGIGKLEKNDFYEGVDDLADREKKLLEKWEAGGYNTGPYSNESWLYATRGLDGQIEEWPVEKWPTKEEQKTIDEVASCLKLLPEGRDVVIDAGLEERPLGKN